MHDHFVRIKALLFVSLLIFSATAANAQINLFGNIATTLDNQWRQASPPWDRTRVYDIGWNVTPTANSFQYAPLGNPPDVLVPVPNTSQSFSNATMNPAAFPYQALCQRTVQHMWVITDGMTGDQVGNFNSLPGIDSASPDSGSTQLRQGEILSRSIHYSQSIQAVVSVPAASSATYQTFFDERPLTNLSFEVDVRIGGSFRFEALRGDCDRDIATAVIAGRCTRASFTQGVGTFYKANPNPHVQVIDDLFVILKLHGRYTGAIGKTPGNFTCEVMAIP